MRKSWLLCVLSATMAWGQAPPSPPLAPKGAAPTTVPTAAEIPENAAVITIIGVCPATPASA
ncbi:MAG: hypothetical protein WB919_01860, partial [Candidatus Sulfotelmatobacter sp.]